MRKRLTHEQVLLIRAQRNSKRPNWLAKEFGISFKAVTKVLTGQVYKYLPLEPEEIGDPYPQYVIKRDRECRGCKITFPLTLEYFHKKGPGLQYRCKPCTIVKNRANAIRAAELKRIQKAAKRRDFIQKYKINHEVSA